MDDFNYNEDYSDLRLYPEKSPSQVIPVLFGLIGAVIGAIPGCILWVFLGKIGFISTASGLVMALGVILGYSFMSQFGSGEAQLGKAACVICLVVIVAAVYISARIVYINRMVDALQEAIPMMQEQIINEVTAEGYDPAQVQQFVTADYVESYLCESFGISTISFSECSRNFSSILTMLDIRGDYIGNLVKCYLFALIGVVWLIIKALGSG